MTEGLWVGYLKYHYSMILSCRKSLNIRQVLTEHANGSYRHTNDHSWRTPDILSYKFFLIKGSDASARFNSSQPFFGFILFSNPPDKPSTFQT